MKEANYKKIAERLWDLLDKIDTASDMFKPCKINGIKSYNNFYKYAISMAEKRFKVLRSDGYKLYTPQEFENRPKDKNGNLKNMKYNR